MLMNLHGPHGPVATTCPASQRTHVYMHTLTNGFIFSNTSISVNLANSIKCMGNSRSYLSYTCALIMLSDIAWIVFLFMFQGIDSGTHCGCYPVFSMGTVVMFVCVWAHIEPKTPLYTHTHLHVLVKIIFFYSIVSNYDEFFYQDPYIAYSV